jgi:hypothetical protein
MADDSDPCGTVTHPVRELAQLEPEETYPATVFAIATLTRNSSSWVGRQLETLDDRLYKLLELGMRIQRRKPSMDPFDEVTSRSQRPGLLRRIPIRISILEVMLLVAVVAVSLRWPGLSVPVGLLSLYALARRQDILSRPTRVAFGQVALALYLPPALGLFLLPLEEWGHYLDHLSLMWTVYPWAGIAAVLEWWFQAHSLLFTLGTAKK